MVYRFTLVTSSTQGSLHLNVFRACAVERDSGGKFSLFALHVLSSCVGYVWWALENGSKNTKAVRSRARVRPNTKVVLVSRGPLLYLEFKVFRYSFSEAIPIFFNRLQSVFFSCPIAITLSPQQLALD